MTAPERLHDAVSAVCPVDGVSVGTGDPPPVRVDFAAGATPDQRAAAAAAVAGFDWAVAAESAWQARRAVADALSATFGGMAPTAISDRVTARYVLTLINDVREHVGLPRILEPGHVVGLMAAVQAGAGEPIDLSGGPS
ncbi:MAG: hypothetical protein ACRC7O_04510 [Fimbriiglobus sp.]